MLLLGLRGIAASLVLPRRLFGGGGPVSADAGVAPPGAAASPVTSPRELRNARVCELRSVALRAAASEREEVEAIGLLLDEALIALAGSKQPPLDALTELVPGDPPTAVLVDAAHGSATTKLLALALAGRLTDMASEAGGAMIVDADENDLKRAGYPVEHRMRCRGTEPANGYAGWPDIVEGERIRVSRLVSGANTRLAVVGRLSLEADRMGPFVLDATLRAFTANVRERALREPSFGYKLLAVSGLGRRVDLVLGDLTAFGAPEKIWRAGEALIGNDLFAVESVGHTILSNLCSVRGLPVPAPHPILQEARRLAVRSASSEGIVWRKVSV